MVKFRFTVLLCLSMMLGYAEPNELITLSSDGETVESSSNATEDEDKLSDESVKNFKRVKDSNWSKAAYIRSGMF